MDVAQKKQEVLEDIARGPESIVFARIDICDLIQLSDLLKAEFIPKLREAANTAHSNTDSLHEVCVNLAHQRALLQGAAAATNPATGILAFNINDGTAATRTDGTAPHNSTGDLSFSKLEDSDYNNKTSFGYTVLHDLNEGGGTVTLSSTSNANTTIADDDGNDVKYFTDFSKYFLTRSRANGELVAIDENTTPYSTPTTAEPFLPANTINGEVYRGEATLPTANTDTRHDFSLVANTGAIGYAGANNDIAENKYVGNTFVVLALSNVSGTFIASEGITDLDANYATLKTQANTTTVVLDASDVKGTFSNGEILTTTTSNAVISSIQTTSNTISILTLTGSTFNTGSNTDINLGFSLSNTISLDTDAVSRSGNEVTVIANSHGINAGERVVVKGADDAFSEFNDTFIVTDATANTLKFTTSNSVSTTPTGDFVIVKNIVYGLTSNASAAVTKRTVNATANLVFQSANLNVGFPVGNTVTGGDSTATGFIDRRTISGSWYQTKTNEVKTYYTASDTGTWDYDATNNPAGIESSANASLFWLKELEMVKINQLVSSTGSGNSFVAPKIILDIAIATSSDGSGGYDSKIDTKVPGVYFSYPMKTYEDQVHDGVTTIEAYANFANVVIAPEGLEINYDWKPLANSSVAATNYNSGTGTGDLHANGNVTTAAYLPVECTTLDKTEFNYHLRTYTSPPAGDDIYLSANSSVRSSGKKVGTSGAVYPSVNANPFYPAVAGSHKTGPGTSPTITANTSDGITGSQPGGLTANDIYAGSYTHYEKGALEPPAATSDPHNDYRYIIQNDLKWTFSVSPFATGSSGAGQVYNQPIGGTGYQATYNGYTTLTRDTTWGKIANTFASHGKDSHTSTATAITADNAVTCGAISNIGNTGNIYLKATHENYADIVVNRSQSCDGTNGTCSGGTADGTESQSECEALGGGATWSWGGYTTTTSDTEFPCLYNRVQWFLTTDGANIAKVTSGTTPPSNMQPIVKVLYQLLLDLTAESYGKDYVDPNEPDVSSYATGQGDASFKTETQDIKNALDALIDRHGIVKGSIANNTNLSYNSTFSNFITEIGTYKDCIKRRITEISNRIGYLNSKDVADGGTTSAPAKSVSGTGQGFQGYSFNGGSGYANTIYAHCNFLAGKKIKLLEKIMKAIEDVDEIYKQIEGKRAEYYEYNASGG